MTVEDRRKQLDALVAARREDEACRWMVAQCGACRHTWNPIWVAADRAKFPEGPIAGWPKGTVVCPKCGSDDAGIVKPTFVE